MRPIRMLWASCFLALTLQGPTAIGAPCAGFSDVTSTDAFCPAVTWMKSRGVTLGCAPGLYCPADSVTRLQMAAFISRLQRVLPLTWVDANGIAIGPDLVNKSGSDAYVVRRTPGGQVVALPISMTTSNFVRTTVYFDAFGCGGNAYVSFPPPPSPAQVNRWGVVNGQALYVSPSPFPTSATFVLVQSYRDPSGTCVPTSPNILEMMSVTLAEDLTAAPLVAPFHVE